MLKKTLTTLALAACFGLTLGTYALADVATAGMFYAFPQFWFAVALVVLVGIIVVTIRAKRRKDRNDR